MIRTSRLALPVTLGLVLCGPVATQGEQKPEKQYVNVASLGMSTRAPSGEEVKQLDLKMRVKIQGQIVSAVSEDGAAAKAGIQKGDAIVKLDKNDIFSQDDIADFLRVSKPGQKIDIQLVRGKNSEEEALSANAAVLAAFVAEPDRVARKLDSRQAQRHHERGVKAYARGNDRY